MKKLFLFIFLILFINIASAEDQEIPDAGKTSLCIVLSQSYANSTFQNITSIQKPDETVEYLNVPMTRNGGGYFNYTYCNTTLNGEYVVNGVGDVDGTNQAWNYIFKVNPLGKIFTQQQAILYLLIFTLAFITFVIVTVIAIYTPSENKRDQMTGYIIAVENLKYVKVFMWCLSYLILMLMMYFGWMISYGYLDMDFVGNLFNIVFLSMAYLVLPMFIVGIYVVIANKVRDSKVQDYLSRGIRLR